MTPALVLNALLTYGPAIMPLLEKASQWVKDGKKEVTAEDIAELIAYGQQKGADYFKKP